MTDPASATTYGEFLRAVAERFGDADAVALDDTTVSFREVEHRSAGLARGLLARGVGKGTRVGFIAANGPDWVVWLSALARIGALAVPLSTFSKAGELVRVLRRADVHGLLVQRSFLGQDLV